MNLTEPQPNPKPITPTETKTSTTPAPGKTHFAIAAQRIIHDLDRALSALVNGPVRISDKSNDHISEHDPKTIAARAALAQAREVEATGTSLEVQSDAAFAVLEARRRYYIKTHPGTLTERFEAGDAHISEIDEAMSEESALITERDAMRAALETILDGDTMKGRETWTLTDVIQEHYRIARAALVLARGAK